MGKGIKGSELYNKGNYHRKAPISIRALSPVRSGLLLIGPGALLLLILRRRFGNPQKHRLLRLSTPLLLQSVANDAFEFPLRLEGEGVVVGYSETAL